MAMSFDVLPSAGLRTLLPEWVLTRWKIARKPQNIEQGMVNDEDKRQVLLTSAFVIPCSIFCGSLIPVPSGGFAPVAPLNPDPLSS
jgi:hypothetical protein